MTLQEINKAYNRIVGSLDSKELKNAFDSLQALIAGSREYSFQDKLNELQDTYKYMLRYRIEGAKDPMQEQIYNNLQASNLLLLQSGSEAESSSCGISPILLQPPKKPEHTAFSHLQTAA